MIASIGGLIVMLGGLFCLIGGIGLLRFPDVYSRLHAAGVTDTMGAGLVMLGLMICCFDPALGTLGIDDVLRMAKLVFILFFMWVTGTTATHAVAKAAWLAELEPWTSEVEGASSKKD
jgi:multicomponent Na+:H+ antiporter subunit G